MSAPIAGQPILDSCTCPILQPSRFLPPLPEKRDGEQKKRARAKFNLFTGAQYHYRLSHLVLGLARGSERDLRRATQKLIRWIYRTTGRKPEYHAAWVREADRIHAHIIISMPYIPQAILLAQFQKYLGEQASLYITLLKNRGNALEKKLHYALQYSAYQKALINYSYTSGWLPPGVKREWAFMKKEMTRQIPGWRLSPDYRAAMIHSLNQWIDEQRIKREQREVIP